MRRHEHLERILRVQIQVRRDAEQQVARLRARLAAVETSEQEMIAALSKGDGSGLSRYVSERLRGLHRERLALEAELVVAEDRWRTIALRTATAERLHQSAVETARRESERKEIEEIASLDALLRASLG